MRTSETTLAKLKYRYYTDEEYRLSVLKRRRIEYASNREKKIADVRAWRKANPDKCAIHAERQKGAKGLLNGAKLRAKKFGLPFNIELCDIVIPTHCPVLGLLLKPSSGHHSPSSPTLDRIIPQLGYVKGNVAVIVAR